MGESALSRCDLKADENMHISCISNLFGRFSEELIAPVGFAQIMPFA